MLMLPGKLVKRLQKRKANGLFRTLGYQKNELVDLSSNDYLGFSSNRDIFDAAQEILQQEDLLYNGATGSRLLSGNHRLYAKTEYETTSFFKSEAALIFNSGYDANAGFFSSVPQRGDIILFDEFCHASIRDGIGLSHASAFKFSHNDLSDLESKIRRSTANSFDGEIYVVTETVFSMDGDTPDLAALRDITKKYSCLLVVDEAHACGVIGRRGQGSVVQRAMEDDVFARIVTFGKAFGAHGAAILGSDSLKEYLINFSRSLIYTTALPPHSVATILATLRAIGKDGGKEVRKLQERILFFTSLLRQQGLQQYFLSSDSAIQSLVCPGNQKVKKLANYFKEEGFDVKPILSPTVPQGKERLRFCLHSYNSEQELNRVMALLAQYNFKEEI